MITPQSNKLKEEKTEEAKKTTRSWKIGKIYLQGKRTIGPAKDREELRNKINQAHDKPHTVKPKNARYQTTESEIDLADYEVHTK